VIDLHCHVLPGIDDGAPSFEDAVALAHVAEAEGTCTLVATPHVSSAYPNDAETIRTLGAELNARLAHESSSRGGGTQLPGIEVRPGAEIEAARVAEMRPEAISQLGLGGGPWLLIECPLTSLASGLELVVADLQRLGHRVVLAHPERCPAFHRDPRLLESLVQTGALTSITAGALGGRFGGAVRRYAWNLLEAGMVHNVASDFHDGLGRPPGIARELEKAGLGPLADWLANQVPAAILEDREIPARPGVRVPALETGGGWWRRWRRSSGVAS
jgi:protein-tyrosine phosphatase